MNHPSDHDTASRTGPRRFGPIGAWLLIVSLLLVAAALVVPWPSKSFVTEDGRNRWQSASAPPRYEILWQPAERLELPGFPADGESLIHPRLAEDGTALYFTLRRAGGEADIYVARRVGGVWEMPQPVAELNTPADDLMGDVSADGQELYLYSDRPGGWGGFDLYVAVRDGQGWSEPRNLGPRINTAANEYAPAISPDGQRLFFSSNRNGRMDDRARNIDEVQDVEWTATLRAAQPLAHYDLYAARRDNSQTDWQPAESLALINRPDANEGTPSVSPSGAFLYFASDRATEDGNRNYDLYRARLDGIIAYGAENLGPGVNTPANELDPASSPEGFRLLFSSDRLADPLDAGPRDGRESPPYGLYSSHATEVFSETEWRSAGLPWIVAYLWWVVTALLLAALIAALVWYLRQVSLKRATVPVFPLIALLVHLLLATGMFFVGIGDDFVKIARQAIDELVAFDYAESAHHQSHEAGQQSYEKVADLTSIEAAETPDVVRQTLDSPNMPVAVEHLAPMTPTVDPSQIPAELVVVVAPPAPSQASQEPILARRPADGLDQTVESEPVEIDATALAERSVETMVEAVEVASARSQPPQPLLEPTLRTAAMPIAPVAESIPVEPEEATAPRARAESPQLARAVPAATDVFDSPADIEAMPNDAPTETSQPAATVDVQVARGAASDTTEPAMPRRAPAPVDLTSAPLAMRLDGDSPTEPAAPRAMDSARPMLARATPLANDPLEPLPVESMETTSDTASSDARDATPPSTDVAVQRQTLLPVANAQPPRSDGSTRTTRPAATISGSSLTASALPLAAMNTTSSPSLVRRPAVAVDMVGEAGPVETPMVAAINAAPMDAAESTAVAVAIARSGAELPPVGFNRPSADPATMPMVSPPTSVARSLRERDKSVESPLQRPRTTDVAAELTRSTAEPGELAFAGDLPLELESATAGPSSMAENGELAGLELELARAEGSLPEAPRKTPDQFGGRFDPARREMIVGSQSNERVDAEPSFTSIASNIARLPARAPLVLYAEDSIGLEAMLRLRQDDGMKRDLLEAFGGNDQTLAAVRRGLVWLEKHQFEDGRWSLGQFHECCRDHAKCDGHGNINSDVAATGFALLPLLGDNHTHRAGHHQAAVDRGLQWLIQRQKEDGELTTGNEGIARLYSHAIAAIALCEAYGMTKDPDLEQPARRAVDFIIQAQHRGSGGWRYQPNQPADTSVVGWQMMALKSAQMAGLSVPDDTFALVTKWLNTVEGQGNNRGRYGYQDRNPKAAMTAEALLCREYLRVKRDDPSLQASADYLLSNLPRAGAETSYYWYYGTQAMFHLQGDYWREWNRSLRDMLLNTQITDGPKQGTWDPHDQWEKGAGRIYSTSLRLLMLEVYYRHLPLYQVLDEVD